jgi:SAM-dependent MidA family methyltransferase
MMTPLKSRIVKHIKTSGSLPLAEYMHWCMADPQDGYYANQEAIGSKGDFITAPEISQMFGEMIGIWAVETWEALGKPSPFNLVELGPGKGTLMSDLLRIGNAVPEFLDAAQVQMIETSEKLIEAQKETLSDYEMIAWQKSIKDIPNQPTLIIANEFLDVLPVRQYIKTGNEWREHAINVDEKNDELVWTLGTGILDEESLPKNADKEPEGAVFEISTIREAFIANASELLKENSGAALFIDYGHTKTDFGDTVQAMRAHGFADILKEPGMADLTAHVDFEALSNTAKKAGMNVKAIIPQGEFLLGKGLIERAGQLGREQSPEIQEQLTQQAERLALPDEMGNLFKVLEFGTV